ncbi:MAG: LysR family transcriptional regulator, partial [Vicinamibacterales bacterium]
MIERPSLHALAVFNAVIEHETMTAAAEAEGISQPAISAHIKSLEGFFGTPLMERSGRRVRPTAAGLLVADYTRRLLRLSDEMCRGVADLEGLRAGQLALGASSTAGEQMLPAVLGRFHRLYPGVQLVLSIGNSGEIVEAVLDRRFDLGIVGRIADHPDLEARPVFDDHLEIFVAHDSPWADRAGLAPADLAGETFVLRESGSATRDLALRCLAADGCVPADTIELGSNEAVKRA